MLIIEKIQKAKNFIYYLLNAKNEYSLHSPLMFNFYTKTLKTTKIKKSSKRQRTIFSFISYFASNKIIMFCYNIEKEKNFIKNNFSNNNITFYELKDIENVYCDFISIISNEKDNILIIFDDIYKNKKSYLLWQKIKQEKRVLICIDFFYIGVVIKNTRFKNKQNYILKNH